MGIQLSYTFYLIFYTNIVNMMRVEMSVLGVHPATTWQGGAPLDT